jgi:hypothetical protein
MPHSLDTSNGSAENGLREVVRHMRRRGRYWLVFASMPVLWGLASNAGPTATALDDAAGGAPQQTAAPVGQAAALAAATTTPDTTTPAPEREADTAPATTTDAVTATATTAIAATATLAVSATATPPSSGAATPTPASSTAVVDTREARACTPTPLTPEGLAQALFDGHVRSFGVPPQADRWACSWAHVAFEQARGQAVYSNNLGHVTARSGAGRVCLRRLRERVAKNPDRWEMTDVWFPVFDSPEDGARAYWQLLSTSYYSFLARCDEAEPRKAAQRLAKIGYFTGPEEPYIDGLAQLFSNARNVLIPRLMAASAGR